MSRIERRGTPSPRSPRKTPTQPAGTAQALAPVSRASQGRGEGGLNPRPLASSLLGPGPPRLSPHDTPSWWSGGPAPHRAHSPQQNRLCRGAKAQGPTAGSPRPPQPNPPGSKSGPQLSCPGQASPPHSKCLSHPESPPAPLACVPTDPPRGFCCRGLPIGQQPRGSSSSHETPSPREVTWASQPKSGVAAGGPWPGCGGASAVPHERSCKVPGRAPSGLTGTPATPRPGHAQERGGTGKARSPGGRRHGPGRRLPRQVLPSTWSRKPGLHSQR